MTTTHGSRIAIRVVFLLVLLAVPAGLAIKRLTGTEPYPALLLPSFGPVLEKNSVVSFRTPDITGVLADGRTIPLDPAKVMPGSTGDGYATVFQTIFTSEARVTDPDAQRWVSEQLARAYPGDQFTGGTVRWDTTHFDVDTGQAVVDAGQPFTIPLGVQS